VNAGVEVAKCGCSKESLK